MVRHRSVVGTSSAIQDEVLLFDINLVYLSDVLQKMSRSFVVGDSIFHLYDKHGRRMNHTDLFEKARVYTFKRKPRHYSQWSKRIALSSQDSSKSYKLTKGSF